MAISQYSSLSNSDLQDLYTSFNNFIQTYGGSITQLTLPTANKKVEASDMNNLNNKINDFRSDKFLKTRLDFWPTGSVTLGDIIQTSNISNIITVKSNFSKVKCRNEVGNNQGYNDNTCSTQGVHPNKCQAQGYHTLSCGCQGQNGVSVACGTNGIKQNEWYSYKLPTATCYSQGTGSTFRWKAEAYTDNYACDAIQRRSVWNEGYYTNCTNRCDDSAGSGMKFSGAVRCDVTCPNDYNNNSTSCPQGGNQNTSCQNTQRYVDCGNVTYSQPCNYGDCRPKGTTIDITCSADSTRNKT